MTAPTLVAEDWRFDPLEPAGAADLYRRMGAAKPRRVLRAELEGYVGLTPRELYELGCTLAPPGVQRVAGMIGWRVVVVAAVVIAAFGVGGAAICCLDAIGVRREHTLDPGRNLGLVAIFLAFAYGGLALMRRGIRRLRGLAAARRRAARRTARTVVDDPRGRATVASLRGPGVLRVQLLWVRGDARNPAYVEVRTLAERRVDEDDAGRAEDAVAAMSEMALRADNAHALRHHGGLTALGLRRRRGKRRAARRAGDSTAHEGDGASETDDGHSRPPEPDDALGTGNGHTLPRDVDHTWEPEPLTDEGHAELARRLVTARPERWSAVSLAPLLIVRSTGLRAEPPPWPEDRTRRPLQLPVRRVTRTLTWGGIAAFVVAMYSGDDGPPSGTGVVVGVAALAVALAAAVLPRVVARRRRDARLARAVRAAAANPPRGLEQGLPGAAGLFTVARAQNRIALLHVRPAPDDGRRGELEVRTLATRRVQDDDLDALTTFCAIAGEARLHAKDVGRSSGYVRRLVARLGRVPARIGEPALWREPLAWVAAVGPAVLVAASIKHTVAGTWLSHGLAARAIGYGWVLLGAYLALVAARRIRDPFAL